MRSIWWGVAALGLVAGPAVAETPPSPCVAILAAYEHDNRNAEIAAIGRIKANSATQVTQVEAEVANAIAEARVNLELLVLNKCTIPTAPMNVELDHLVPGDGNR